MSHALSGIPSGSRVIIRANMRFPHDELVCSTGAIRVHATPEAYPVLVCVRPPSGPTTQSLPGGRKGFKNYGPMEILAPRIKASGTDIDFALRNADDHREPGSEAYLKVRRARSETRLEQISMPSSPETDIYSRVVCSAGCGALVPSIGPCAACKPAETEKFCVAPNRHADGSMSECRAVRYAHYDVCEAHARESGLIASAPSPAPDAARCVWSGCTAARFKTFVMCAEHAYEAGLLAPAAEPAAATVPAPKAKRAHTARPRRDPLAPTAKRRGGTAVHKPDCQCFICIRGLKITETPEVLVAAGKAEAEEPGR